MKTQRGLRFSHVVFFSYIIATLIILQLAACEKDERTTGVYGTVTDPDGKPVEGVKVLVYGSKNCGPVMHFGEDYTDKTGAYSITFEASADLKDFNTAVPLSKTENPEIFKNFHEMTFRKNDEAVDKCCITPPGDKTKFDFKLVSK